MNRKVYVWNQDKKFKRIPFSGLTERGLPSSAYLSSFVTYMELKWMTEYFIGNEGPLQDLLNPIF